MTNRTTFGCPGSIFNLESTLINRYAYVWTVCTHEQVRLPYHCPLVYCPAELYKWLSSLQQPLAHLYCGE